MYITHVYVQVTAKPMSLWNRKHKCWWLAQTPTNLLASRSHWVSTVLENLSCYITS